MDTTRVTPVQVIGHRGAPGPQRRENTVRAVEAALARGADGVEVDVRLTGDGALVCSHDPSMRTALGDALTVVRHTLPDLRRAARRAGEPVATLAQVLVAVRRAGPRRLVVELKPVADALTAGRTVAAVVEALAGAGPETEVTVSSFDWALLDQMGARWAIALPGRPVRTALLGPRGVPAHVVLRHAVEEGHAEVHLGLDTLRRAPHAVRLARHLGVGVVVWTVNGRDDLRRVAGWGVDAVITDDVVLAQEALRVGPAPAPDGLAAC